MSMADFCIWAIVFIVGFALGLFVNNADCDCPDHDAEWLDGYATGKRKRK